MKYQLVDFFNKLSERNSEFLDTILENEHLRPYILVIVDVLLITWSHLLEWLMPLASQYLLLVLCIVKAYDIFLFKVQKNHFNF